MDESLAVVITVLATVAAALISFPFAILARRGLLVRDARRLLLVLALISAVATGAALIRATAADSGLAFAVLLAGVPVIVPFGRLLLLGVDQRAGRVLDWLSALVVVAIVAFFLPSVGLFYLPAAVLMVGAAMSSSPLTDAEPVEHR